jgi:hypothetical protein
MIRVNPYQPGAALQDGSYVVREADEKLQRAILDNKLFPYFLSARQSGKSSILARTQSVLKSSELRIAIVDLSGFAPVALSSYERFVSAFIAEILTEIGNEDELREKLTSAEATGNARFLLESIRAIIAHMTGRLVVCIDEIDVLKRCDFKDAFLGHIRSLCNRRSRESALRRIQFVLAGATSSENLISDLLQSPFNVGEPITLDDLSADRVRALLLQGWPADTRGIAEATEMLSQWTSGSVFLCQHVLHRVFNRFSDESDATPLPQMIEETIAQTIQESSEVIHFRDIHRTMSANPTLLGKWRAWSTGAVPSIATINDLMIIGICRQDVPFRNKLYQVIFGSRGPLRLVVSEPRLVSRNAWTFDADNIDIRDITPDNIYQYVVRTPAVESFLRYGAEDRKYFVVAPKGLGKTFLLKVKSKFYRENVSGYKHHCIPSGDELVEKLTSIRVSFSKEELGKFRRIETWEKTWELSLLTMMLRNFNTELPSALEALIGEARSLLDILSAFLRSRNAIDRLYSEHVSTSLRPKVGELSRLGANQIAIFIDNIDEGIEMHGYSLKHHAETLSGDVWVNAQLGIMKVIRDLCTRYKHVKIFVSVRSEAFRMLEAQTSLQYQEMASILTYTKAQLKEIFEQNIAKTKRENLARPDAINDIERFTGLSKMDHRFVQDGGTLRREDIFDFIVRHTFGRPREIVLMGSRIGEIPVSERSRDGEAVREMVNSVSTAILDQLKREIVPYFEEEAFDRFCELIQSNVISTKQAQAISNHISEGMQFQHDIFSYLYSIGLVGTTEWNFRRKQFIQKFLPVGHYSLTEDIPPKASKYFVIHSAVDKILRDKHGRAFYDKHNIIGNDLSFQEPQ